MITSLPSKSSLTTLVTTNSSTTDFWRIISSNIDVGGSKITVPKIIHINYTFCPRLHITAKSRSKLSLQCFTSGYKCDVVTYEGSTFSYIQKQSCGVCIVQKMLSKIFENSKEKNCVGVCF